MESLNSLEIDALKEIGSIGMGNATTALSKLVERNVQLNLSDARMFNLQNTVSSIPDSITMTGVIVNIGGEIRGAAVLLFEFNNSVLLSNLMLDSSGITGDPTMNESALSELGNIFTGSYMNAMSSFLDLGIYQSQPIVTIGPIQEIFETAITRIGTKAGGLLNIETMFMVHNAGDSTGLNTVYGDMFLLLEPASTEKLRDSIRKMLA
ncbi:chemotaxis protein CheC [Methanolobus sp. ZRKC2]|uniref:chemotaxis protein CheC n=1 Tax=Methanolobus sp. ZRKC2 TaxID=3125783 RepID=UPI00324BDB8B